MTVVSTRRASKYCLGTFDTQLFHFAIQRRNRHSQQTRRPFSPFYLPVGSFEYCENIAAFKFKERHYFGVLSNG